MKNIDVIFVGTGQSSIIGAYKLVTNNPSLRILFIDKGLQWQDRLNAVDSKQKSAMSPIVYGVGGAGAFSDCKFNLDYRVGGDVYTITGREAVDARIRETVEIYKQFGCDVEPIGAGSNTTMDRIKRSCIENQVQLVDTLTMHLGTDGSRILYTKLLDFLQAQPTISFETSSEWEGLIIEQGAIRGVVYSKDGESRTVYAEHVVVAVGRSGASKMQSIAKQHGIDFEDGGVDIGVRAEIPDVIMSDINTNYYEAKMVYYTNCYNDKVRTFCSNPSGFVAVEEHEENIVLANGHAYKKRKSTNTNLALLCTQKFTQPFDEPFTYAYSIARMSAMLTGGKILCQSYMDLKKGHRSTQESLDRLNIMPTLTDYVAGDISLACPKRILDNIMEFIEVHGRITPGFASGDLLLYFPEIKLRSVRLKLNEHMETSIQGLYSAGDSSGYGSGLNQAAVMGLLAAEDILRKTS